MKKNHQSNESIFDAKVRLKEREYWLNKLSGDLPTSNFPYDRSNHLSTQHTRHSINFKLTGEIYSQLLRLSNKSDVRLYIIFATSIMLLLYKYTGNEDIIIGSPIYRQEIEKDLINKILILRTQLINPMSFKELLLNVSKTNSEAFAHINYPIENLPYELNLTFQKNEFPLCDIGVLVDNIHKKSYIDHLNLNIIFTFHSGDGEIEASIEYNADLYDNETINRISNHFINLTQKAIFNIEGKISDLFILPDAEKKQLLDVFNASITAYSHKKTIHQLFEDQAKKTPDHIALLDGKSDKLGANNYSVKKTSSAVTYQQLNQYAHQLASFLIEKGVKNDLPVALLMERSPHFIISVLGVLKAGGAYLPIDTDYPEDRIAFILKESNTKILLTGTNNNNVNLTVRLNDPSIQIIEISKNLFSSDSTLLPIANSVGPGNLAYIIYTSGTTGNPKGVMIEHQAVVNYICWAARTYVKEKRCNFPLYSSISFDLTVTSIFTPLITGNTIIVYTRVDKDILFEKILEDQRIGVIKLTPSHLYIIKNKTKIQSNIQCFIVGGENLETHIANEIYNLSGGKAEIYNEYGPTETTVGCTYYQFDPQEDQEGSVPIGKPTGNMQIYILDKYKKIIPIGVQGELYVSGHGVARGYLNGVEITAEKFSSNCFSKRKGNQKLYQTGDIARWKLDGNLEFLGRIDHQVKIRGFRIETAEIEQQLLGHKDIREALVVTNNPNKKNHDYEKSDPYLCAYIVTVNGKKIQNSKIREYLHQNLPEYMIPLVYMQIKEIPLTSNGKVNRRALPKPKVSSEQEYIAPQNEVQQKLTGIWSEVLGVEKEQIGINANFFELGGHSLKQVGLISEIQKEFNVKISLAEIFKIPSIKQLADKIEKSSEVEYNIIENSEKKEYYKTSSSQKRIFFLHQLDDTGIGYNVPILFKLEEELDKEKFQKVINQLIQRHEAFRTSFSMKDEKPIQYIHCIDQIKIEFEYYKISTEEYKKINSDLKQNKNLDQIHQKSSKNSSGWLPIFGKTDPVVEKIIREKIRSFDLSKAPLARVQIFSIDTKKHIFVFDMHHIITDGSSQNIIEKEFISLYSNPDIQINPINLQYKDFSEWENSLKYRDILKSQENFWLKEFPESDILPILNLPTDNPRPSIQSFKGNHLNFSLNLKETHIIKTLAKENDTTLFMFLLGIFNILFSKLSGQKDIIIGVPIATRRHPDLKRVVGMMVNTLPMRNFPFSDKTFKEFLQEVKQRTLKAFDNQEYPFENIVDKLFIERDTSRNPLFDILFNMLNQWDTTREISDTDDQELFDHKQGISKFDMNFNAIDYGEKIHFFLEYSTMLFNPNTIERFITYLKNIISWLWKNTHQKISAIPIVTDREKNEVLEMCNGRKEPLDFSLTLNTLLLNHAKKQPDVIALISPRNSANNDSHKKTDSHLISYIELQKHSTQLSEVLIKQGIANNTIVGIMVECSIEMVIGIFGILQAGGAYLPIDPNFPDQRIKYILKDSNTNLCITTGNIYKKKEELINSSKYGGINFQIFDHLEINNHMESTPPHPQDQHNNSLAYTIYTSGTTGNPKGVLIQQHDVVNRLLSLNKRYLFSANDIYMVKTSYLFDVSVTEIFGWLFKGGKAVLLKWEDQKDPEELINTIECIGVTHINFVPSQFNVFVETLKQHEITRIISLKYIFLAGETLPPNLVRKFNKLDTNICIENIYGPTEGTIYVSKFSLSEWNEIGSIPIGKPLENNTIYIFDKNFQILPVGVSGELMIKGLGLAEGYLNQPTLTSEKFFLHKSSLLYRTGDLGFWREDGNIEFLGRLDHQVKIRGFRIELKEIENILSSNKTLKEVVVINKLDENRDGFLCAYLVPRSPNSINTNKLKLSLQQKLPYYMIPAHFIILEQIPLTTSGKVNVKQLPQPQLKRSQNFSAPTNQIEEKLLEIWETVLGKSTSKKKYNGYSSIGIDDNFFELGGHSLTQISIALKIHEEMNVKLKISEIFKNPTIRSLGIQVKKSKHKLHLSITATEKKEYYPLALQQRRFFIFHQLEPKNLLYNVTSVLMLEGKPNQEKLENAFAKLIKRHENLRTSFKLVENEPAQFINKEVNFSIQQWNISLNEDIQKEENAMIASMINQFIQPFHFSNPPLMRVGLIRLEDTKYIFIVDIHHIITDGISEKLFTNEFLQLYAGNPLAPLPIQYKDFSQWQNSEDQKEKIKKQGQYWLKKFEDEISILNLTTDYPIPKYRKYEGETLDFEISKEDTKALKKIALEENGSIFMVLLSAYFILLSKLSGQVDIIIGTGVSGRDHANLMNIIGLMFNTIPLQNQVKTDISFAQFLKEVKANTLEAFENQEYPFDQLVEDLLKHQLLVRDTSRNPLFNTMFAMQNFREKDFFNQLETSNFKLKPYGYDFRGSRFDLFLYGTELNDIIQMKLEYSTAIFKSSTAEKIKTYYLKIISKIIENKEIKIEDIIIFSTDLLRINVKQDVNQKEFSNFSF